MAGRKSEITQEQYESLKARGLSDIAISKELKINKSSVSRAKRKWGIESSSPKSSCTEPNESASDSSSTLSMLRDSMITVRDQLLKQIGKTPELAERSVETLVKLSGEIRQLALAIENQRETLTDRGTVFRFFAGVFGILKDELDLEKRRMITQRIIALRNALAGTGEIKTILTGAGPESEVVE